MRSLDRSRAPRRSAWHADLCHLRHVKRSAQSADSRRRKRDRCSRPSGFRSQGANTVSLRRHGVETDHVAFVVGDDRDEAVAANGELRPHD